MAHDPRSLWRPARVVGNNPVAHGSMWLTLEADDDLPASYEPGHVLGLGLREDGALIRHAYTISRADSAHRRFEHLYRVIPTGRMTPRLAGLRAGDSVYFHGPFHTPIREEVDPTAGRIVLIATGTGIGPIFGYAEQALRDGETRPLTLYAGFREASDLCLTKDLEELQHTYPNFAWRFTLSSPAASWTGLTGRVTDCVPDQISPDKLGACHFHLVGNGEMVQLTRAALLSSGVRPERVSIETYFNHYVRPEESEVARLAARFRAGAAALNTQRVIAPE